MIRVFEARVPASHLGGSRYGGERHKIHARVDSLLLPLHRDDMPRTYTWAKVDETVLIRSSVAREGFFTPVAYPDDGAIAFEFDAAPKRGHAGAGRKKSRRALQPGEYNSWAEIKLMQCGIKMTDLEVWPYVATIANRKTQQAAMIIGSGSIVDTSSFHEALANGIAGAGPKCWGFGCFVINWR